MTNSNNNKPECRYGGWSLGGYNCPRCGDRIEDDDDEVHFCGHMYTSSPSGANTVTLPLQEDVLYVHPWDECE